MDSECASGKSWVFAVPQAVAGNAWHADHILPVYRGGGLCTLENLRTLCVVCHQVRAARGLGQGRSPEQE